MVHSDGDRILVVDDDEELTGLLRLVLEGEGYDVAVVQDALGAIDAVQKGPTDLVILDISLGRDDGRIVLGEIRSLGDIPVIFISGHGQTEDRVLGLRLGADDYLAKPFSMVELVARVESVLRRARPTGGIGGDVTFTPTEGLSINELTHDVHIDGRNVELTAKEFDLLAFLARSPRQVFSRAQLLEQVWQSLPGWQDEATVTEHVRRVRQKVEKDPEHPRWITTVRGVGYRFEP